MMDWEIIHQHDRAHPQLGYQNLLNIEQEHIGIDAADDAQGGNQAIDSHAANQRNVLPTMTGRFRIIQALANRSATVEASLAQMHPGLIDKHQIARVDRESPVSMSKAQVLNPLRILLSGNQGFFLTLNSKRCTARCTVAFAPYGSLR